MTRRACTASFSGFVVGVVALGLAVGWRARAADPPAPANTVFVPKSPLERAAFNAAADEKERIANAEEKESRSTVLPTLVHPFESPVTHPGIEIERAAIPMRDGVKLRGSVYRPKQGGKYPVILQTGPYDMEKNLDEMPALFRNLARRGYAVVAADSRGRYGSEGMFRPFDDEIDNTFDAVAWAGSQPWSNGKVGLTGISYLGWTSYSAGIASPPGLVAIMPSAINYGLENPHGVAYLGSMAGWLIWAGRPGAPATAVTRRIDWLHLPLDSIDDEAGLPSPGFDAMVTEKHLHVPGALTREEIENRLAKITVPTYVVAGWYDELNERMLANYVHQARHSKDLRLVVGPWHHNINTAYRGPEKIGIVSASDPHLDRYYHEMERFFGRYLKGDGMAWEPPGRVLLYVMGSNEWRYEDEWPLTRAVKTPVYLCNGIVQASYREGIGQRKLIDPGTIYAYTFKLLPISNCFQKGHRIRIEVTSSDMDRYARNQNMADPPGTTANVAVARQAIHHGGNYPSRLDLPVIPRAE
jgi:predicted acyl esterase